MSATRSLRPAPGEDAAAWTRAVFAAHDHAGAAMFGDPATWQCRAARAMVRGFPADFAALAAFSEPEARLHLGAAHWIHGDEAAAKRVLAAVELPHARRLLAMLGRERIQVLAQLPWMRGTANDLMSGIAADPRFEVRNVSNHPLDVQHHPYASVHSWLDADFVPDFYVCAMAEWHHLPPDLQSLPCPILGHVADHDLHVQTLKPWLPVFDELLVTDRTEWLDVRGWVERPVSSFPKVFGLPAPAPLPDGPRTLDFFVSGTMLDPFHPDKAARMHEVLSLPDIDVCVVRGFAGAAAYDALLGASKASFTYVRRPGAMPTRGLEALAMGCAVALQEESILNLWVGRDEGVATYSDRPGALADCLQGLLAEFAHYGPAARRGAAVVRREFDLCRVASQYLRYCAFRAAAPRAPRVTIDTRRLVQSRISVRRTCLPTNPMVRRRTMQANFHRLRAVLAAAPAASTIAAMARELLCEFAFYAHRGEAGHEERTFFADAVQLLERGIRLWPDRLVLRFDLVRALLCHGDPTERLRGWQLAWDTLHADVVWRVDPMDDVLPFDFDAETFDHRGYVGLVARASRGEPVADHVLARPMLAALAGHLGRKMRRVDLLELAVAFAPDFARHRLDLAQQLLADGDAAARPRAIALLQELARGSAEFERASANLAELRAAGETVVFDDLPLRRLHENVLDAGAGLGDLTAFGAPPPAEPVTRTRLLPDAVPPARLSVLVAEAMAVPELAALVADLGMQSIARAIEVVLVDGGTPARLAPVLQAGSATPLRVRVVAGAGDLPARLDACAAAASAPLWTVLSKGDRLRRDACELLCRELESAPAALAATANEGVAGQQLADFQTQNLRGVSCLQAPSAARMATGECLGMFTVWRGSLHAHHGGFGGAVAGADPVFALFARGVPPGALRQRREVLCTCDVTAARARRVAGRGARSRWLDAGLAAPGLAEEAKWAASVGLCSAAEANDVRSLEAFYGTAVVHGDLRVAAIVLRSCVARFPGLLSARLVLARLLDALAAPGGADLLRAGLANEPHAVVLRRHLQRYPSPSSEEVPSA